MKITLKEIWNSQQSIGKLISQDLDLKASYWINKQAKKITAKIEEINDQRNKLVEKYGEKQPNGNFNVKQDSKNWKKLSDEFDKLLEIEDELDIQTIKFDYLKDAKLAPVDFMNLDYLIDAPAEESPKNEVPVESKESK